MRKFEFRISVVAPDWLTRRDGEDALRELNTLGDDGWELAGVFPYPAPSVTVIMQRAIATSDE